MEDFTTINRRLDREPDSLQEALAMRFLERHGKRYLVDFGYANAIEKARELAKTQPKNREKFL